MAALEAWICCDFLGYKYVTIETYECKLKHVYVRNIYYSEGGKKCSKMRARVCELIVP